MGSESENILKSTKEELQQSRNEIEKLKNENEGLNKNIEAEKSENLKRKNITETIMKKLKDDLKLEKGKTKNGIEDSKSLQNKINSLENDKKLVENARDGNEQSC